MQISIFSWMLLSCLGLSASLTARADVAPVKKLLFCSYIKCNYQKLNHSTGYDDPYRLEVAPDLSSIIDHKLNSQGTVVQSWQMHKQGEVLAGMPWDSFVKRPSVTVEDSFDNLGNPIRQMHASGITSQGWWWKEGLTLWSDGSVSYFSGDSLSERHYRCENDCKVVESVSNIPGSLVFDLEIERNEPNHNLWPSQCKYYGQKTETYHHQNQVLAAETHSLAGKNSIRIDAAWLASQNCYYANPGFPKTVNLEAGKSFSVNLTPLELTLANKARITFSAAFKPNGKWEIRSLCEWQTICDTKGSEARTIIQK